MSNSLYVAWRSGDSANGQWAPVARLDYDGAIYKFSYTRGAEILKGFCPFPGMSRLDSVYKSQELLPLFENRILGSSRSEYKAFLEWSGFDPKTPPDPLALLAVSEGLRATDSFEVFPHPVPDVDGQYTSKFFLHGIRHQPKAALERIERLRPEERLLLRPESENQNDRNAVAVHAFNNELDMPRIGYVPRYLAYDYRELCAKSDPRSICLKVKRINSKAPFQQRLLCEMTAQWPGSFRPCSREEYHPIVREVAA